MKPLAKRVYLSTPTMHGDEQKYIKEAFDTNWVAPLGKNVDEFENEIKNYVGMEHSAALTTGTAALHLAMKLVPIKRDDIVFCSDLTFAATVNPVSYEGAKQVFIDSELDTWNMDPQALKKAFKKYDGINFQKPKAVVVVHLYGTPAKMKEIKTICDEYDVPIIEDAAESLGAIYNNQQTGTFGKYSILSFNGNKLITTSGGGMLLSNNEEDIIKARFWATQSRDPAPWYQHSEIGYNYRMSNILAGIGRGQVPYINNHISLKKEIYMRYQEGLKGLPIKMNPYLMNSEPNFWLSCIILDENAQVKPMDIYNKLSEYNIESRPIWKPMHLQPIFEKNDFISVENDNSKYIFDNGLCLPSDIKMTIEEQNIVIKLIGECFN